MNDHLTLTVLILNLTYIAKKLKESIIAAPNNSPLLNLIENTRLSRINAYTTKIYCRIKINADCSI